MDIKTLGFVYVLVSLATAGLLILQYFVISNFRETKYWAVGSILNAMAGTLFTLRGVATDFFSIYVAHVLVLSGHAFYIVGIRVHLLRETYWKALLSFALIASLPFLIFISPDYFKPRMIASSFFLAALNLVAAYTLMAGITSERFRSIRIVTGLAFLAAGAIFLIRGGQYLGVQTSNTDLLNASEITNQLVFIMVSLANIITTAGFLLMISGRANGQLNEKLAIMEAASEEKSKFLAMLGHEIRTPLAVLKALLSNRRLNQSHIRLAVQSINELDDIVTASQLAERVDGGELKLKIEEINIRDCIDDLIKKGNAKSEFSIKIEGSQYLFSDKFFVYCILRNLIDNHLKYSCRRRGAAIEVINRRDQLHWEIIISSSVENSKDINAEMIFEKYYRGARARSKSGSGLGLYIVKGLAEALGGTASAVVREDTITFKVMLGKKRLLDHALASVS